MVPDVTDVFVFPASVVIAFRDGFHLLLGLGFFVKPQSFSFSEKRVLDSYAGRDEVRRFSSESAPAFKKKNDAANTTAKIVFII